MKYDCFNDLLPMIDEHIGTGPAPKFTELNNNLIQFKRTQTFQDLKSVMNLNIDSKRKKIKEIDPYCKEIANLIILPTQILPRRYLFDNVLSRYLNHSQVKAMQINQSHFKRMKLASNGLVSRMQIFNQADSCNYKTSKAWESQFKEYYGESEGLPLLIAWWQPEIYKQIELNRVKIKREELKDDLVLYERFFQLICSVKRAEEFEDQLKESQHKIEDNFKPQILDQFYDIQYQEILRAQLFSEIVLGSRLAFLFEVSSHSIPLTFLQIIQQIVIVNTTSPYSRCMVEEEIEKIHRKLRAQLQQNNSLKTLHCRTSDLQVDQSSINSIVCLNNSMKQLEPIRNYPTPKPPVPFVKNIQPPSERRNPNIKGFSKRQEIISSFKRDDLRQLSIIKSASKQEEDQLPIEQYSRKKPRIKESEEFNQSSSSNSYLFKDTCEKKIHVSSSQSNSNSFELPQPKGYITGKNSRSINRYNPAQDVRISKPRKFNHLSKQLQLILPQKIQQRKIGSNTFAIYQVQNRSTKRPPTSIKEQFELFKKQKMGKCQQVFSQVRPIAQESKEKNNGDLNIRKMLASNKKTFLPEQKVEQKGKSLVDKFALYAPVQSIIEEKSKHWFPFNIESVVVQGQLGYLLYYFPSIDQQHLALNYMMDKIKYKITRVYISISLKDAKEKQILLFKYMTVLTLLGAKCFVKVSDKTSQCYNKKGQTTIKTLTFLSGLPLDDVVRDRARSRGPIY